MAFWNRGITRQAHPPVETFNREKPPSLVNDPKGAGSFRRPAPGIWVNNRPRKIKVRSRVSQDNPTLGYLQGLTVIAPFSADERWRALKLDEFTLDNIGTADLLELLSGVSPDVSNALWQMLRMCNPGYDVKVMTLDPTPQVHAQGTAYVKSVIQQLGELYGSFDVILNKLFIGAFLRGAFAAELVFADNSRDVADLAVPDARWIYFEIMIDPVRGPVWVPFQWVKGQKILLDRLTIRYVPVDPLPGSPIGRAMCEPAIFTCLFVVGMLHDLRRVVQQQGYPRLDLKVMLEKLLLTLPPDIAADPAKTQDWVDRAVQDIGDAYSSLEPDDAYVHTDNVEIGRPVGAVDTSSLGAVEGLMAALDRQLTRALKTMPLLMGSNEASSETHANRQWEVYVAGIRSLQLLAEGMLDYLFNLALRARGIQAKTQLRFAELRKSELLRDAQVKKLTILNAAIAYDRGWISQDQAAKQGYDIDKADQAEPRIPGAGLTGGAFGSGGGDGGAGSGAPEGTQKAVPLSGLRDHDDDRLVTNGNGHSASKNGKKETPVTVSNV